MTKSWVLSVLVFDRGSLPCTKDEVIVMNVRTMKIGTRIEVGSEWGCNQTSDIPVYPKLGDSPKWQFHGLIKQRYVGYSVIITHCNDKTITVYPSNIVGYHCGML